MGVQDGSADASGGVLYSVVMGIVEGLTEFLPVSSTGHLIVTSAAFGRSDPAFEVAIQAGAITAILVLYWRRLWQSLVSLRSTAKGVGGGTNLLWLLFIAALPAAIIGKLFDEWIEARLFSPEVVAIALIVGGVGLFVLEAWRDRRAAAGVETALPMEAMTPRQALIIGFWQTLALIPGTSRSGATIAGGLVCGLSRGAAAEFSFLVGLPILYGACALKLWSDFERFAGPALPDLVIASVASFITALLIVGPFVRFLQDHTFRPFAFYRVLAGAALLALCFAGVL